MLNPATNDDDTAESKLNQNVYQIPYRISHFQHSHSQKDFNSKTYTALTDLNCFTMEVSLI